MTDARINLKPGIPERILYPKKEAAALLGGISVRTLENFIANNVLRSRVIGGRRLIHIDEIKRFARSDHPLSERTSRASTIVSGSE